MTPLHMVPRLPRTTPRAALWARARCQLQHISSCVVAGTRSSNAGSRGKQYMVDSTAAYERGTEAPSFSTENGDRESAKRGLGAMSRTLDGVEDAGPEHASALLKMGALMQEAGDYPEAEELFRRALAIGERTLGPDNPALLPALTSLAAAHIMCGKFEDAKPLVIRGLAVSESGLAEHDPDLAIDWGISPSAAILSAKDAAAPWMRDFVTPFRAAPVSGVGIAP